MSDFALVGRLEILVRRYGPRARVGPEVLDEVLDEITGEATMRWPTSTPRSTLVPWALPTSCRPGRGSLYRELLRHLAPGEAPCIIRAKAAGGVVVTDDRATRHRPRARCPLHGDHRHPQGVLPGRNAGHRGGGRNPRGDGRRRVFRAGPADQPSVVSRPPLPNPPSCACFVRVPATQPESLPGAWPVPGRVGACGLPVVLSGTPTGTCTLTGRVRTDRCRGLPHAHAVAAGAPSPPPCETDGRAGV
jgi:hypothetical protein